MENFNRKLDKNNGDLPAVIYEGDEFPAKPAPPSERRSHNI
ncbi:3778_t:CDS:2, partial [Dentiscutata heterogama]